MFQKERTSTEAIAPLPPAVPGGPYWRTLLEARWQALLREVTELALAYHAAGDHDQRLMCQTIAARRRLADVEEALGRLAAGTFGRCEQCRLPIPARLLAVSPERRYCPPCGRFSQR
jgi:RNA polymerase-binding transcription factor DksA